MRSDIIACYPFRFGAAFPAGYGRPVLPLQLQRLPNETHICWCEMCAERGTPRSLRLPTIPYSLTFMWWRTRTDKVCCYAFSRVGRGRHQTNARNFFSFSFFSICPSCRASFSSRSVMCVCTSVCVLAIPARKADLIDATLPRQHTSRPDYSLEPTWRSSLCSGDIPKTVGTSSNPMHSPTHAALRGIGRLCWTLTVVYKIIGLM